MLLVGFDAASRREKFGFAIGTLAEGQVGPVEAGTLVTKGELPALIGLVDASPDEFDAALCLLAAKDFLESKALPPEDAALARREGWIWVCAPGS